MMWFLLALAAGFLNALSSAFSKKALREIDPYAVPFFTSLFALPFFALALICGGWQTPSSPFWLALAISGSINVIASIAMMHALKNGDLSLTVPYLAFTPLFLIFTSNLILGETVRLTGFLGIILIAGGAWFLNWNKSDGFSGAFASFKKNRASQLALFVAFLYSISTNFDKIGIKNSNPVLYPAAFYFSQLIIFLPIVIRRKSVNAASLKKNILFLFPVGPLSAATLLAYSLALTTGLVAYVIALKRTLALWGVLIGCLTFKEKNLWPKLAGAVLMVAGVFLIALG